MGRKIKNMDTKLIVYLASALIIGFLGGIRFHKFRINFAVFECLRPYQKAIHEHKPVPVMEIFDKLLDILTYKN